MAEASKNKDMEFADTIGLGVLFIISPIWLPLWIAGWSVKQVYNFWQTLKSNKRDKV